MGWKLYSLTGQNFIDSVYWLHIPPTSVDRTMTNASVKELLKNHYGVTVLGFSKLRLKRKNQLLGRIIRADPQDPTHQVLFLPYSLIPRTEHARRVGKPRGHWLIETYADTSRESGHVDQFDINNILQRHLVNELAQQRPTIFFLTLRRPPFHRKFHHRKIRHRKFRDRNRAYSRPGLRNNNRFLHLFAPFLFLFLIICFFSVFFCDSGQKSWCCKVRKFSFILRGR